MHELAFFDVKVFNPLARTYMNQSLEAAFKTNKNNKKRLYNNHIIQAEKGTFTPVVFIIPWWIQSGERSFFGKTDRSGVTKEKS